MNGVCRRHVYERERVVYAGRLPLGTSRKLIEDEFNARGVRFERGGICTGQPCGSLVFSPPVYSPTDLVEIGAEGGIVCSNTLYVALVSMPREEYVHFELDSDVLK